MAVMAAPASAERYLEPASYPGMTTFQCRTGAIPIHPGQNLNDIAVTKTCPNAAKVRGSLDPSIFDNGSDAEGYVTRFKPSMVEILPNGKLVTPSVWDLHLHHVVWVDIAEGDQPPSPPARRRRTPSSHRAMASRSTPTPTGGSTR